MVLIDKIDKAPRDVPNDLLSEIDQDEFHIPKLEVALRREIRIGLPRSEAGDQEARLDPLVIIASNSEKALPEAFLGRCVYFHVLFPPFQDDLKKDIKAVTIDTVTVERIVEQRFYDCYRDEQDNLVRDAISLFKFIRGDFQADRNTLVPMFQRGNEGAAVNPSDRLGKFLCCLWLNFQDLLFRFYAGRAAAPGDPGAT